MLQAGQFCAAAALASARNRIRVLISCSINVASRPFIRYPIDGEVLTTTKLPTTLRFPKIPTGEHWAVLARHASEARYAYLARSKLKKSDRVAGRRLASVRGQIYNLRVELKKSTPKAIHHSVPILLRRPDNPLWRCLQPFLTDANGHMQFKDLGHGHYLLHPDGFAQQGNTPAWLPIKLDQDRVIRITGAAQ